MDMVKNNLKPENFKTLEQIHEHQKEEWDFILDEWEEGIFLID